METKRPLKIKFVAKSKSKSLDNANNRAVLLPPELPGGLDVACASPSSIVATVRAQGLGSVQGICLPEWHTFFEPQVTPNGLPSHPGSSQHSPHSSPSSQPASDTSRKRKHTHTVDVVADATARLAVPKQSSPTPPPNNNNTSINNSQQRTSYPTPHESRVERPSGKGSKSENEGSTPNAAAQADISHRKRAAAQLGTPRGGQEACSVAAQPQPDTTPHKRLTIDLGTNNSNTLMKGSISPSLAAQPAPADSSPSPNQQHNSHSPLLTSTSSKPSHPPRYAPPPPTTDTPTQTDTPPAPVTHQECQAGGSALPHPTLIRLLELSPHDCHPFHLFSQALLDITPALEVPPSDWPQKHKEVCEKARKLKHKADNMKAPTKPWSLDGLLYYCLAGIRFLEAYEYLRLMHRHRMKLPNSQKPIQLLEQTVAFQQTTVQYVRALHASDAAGGRQPRVAVQALLLLCRRLLAISQSHLLLQQQQMLRDATRQMRETLAQRASAPAAKEAHHHHHHHHHQQQQQPSPDADSASSETLSTREAVGTQEDKAAHSASSLLAGAEGGSGQGPSAPGSASREAQKVANGRGAAPAGGGLEKRVLGALETMLHAADAWRSTSEELQRFMSRVAKEGVAGGHQVALHIYALGLDGGMGDILHTVQLACKVVDTICVLAKAAEAGPGSATKQRAAAPEPSAAGDERP